ncbi:HPP-domain-containing protein [Martensiomyces pterosporus]|nr:HPP-domain-containing protein [Martensiomyces pterosporus]
MPPVLTWSLFSGVTSFLGMATIGLIQKYGSAISDHHLPFAIAPFGATAVLIFAVPAAPLAQPRNVILGHLVAALTGIFVFEIFKHVDDSLHWLPGALAVGIAIALMGLINCYHPPAGATAFLAGFYSPDVERVRWWYPLYPVLAVALIMVAISVILNNICRVFPVYWFTPAKPPAPEHVSHASKETPEAKQPDSRDSPSGTVSSSSSVVSAAELEVGNSGDAEIEIERHINEHIGNEYETENAWLLARIHELEHELHELRTRHPRPI